MSRRIAHRPRYHSPQTFSHFSLHASKAYLREHWTYRRQVQRYEPHRLGYGLSFIPLHRSLRDLPGPSLA